jgi:hypothetical protein
LEGSVSVEIDEQWSLPDRGMNVIEGLKEQWMMAMSILPAGLKGW